MTMTKREIAVASVASILGNTMDTTFATGIIDQLITDGIISLAYAGAPDIGEVCDQFQIAVGNTAVIKTDRFAAQRLAKRYGAAVVVHVIQEYGKRRREQYAPVANSLTEFERKWPSIEKFISNTSTELDV